VSNDFRKIKAGLSVDRSRIGAASFARNVKIGVSLFATGDIEFGETIRYEKAFCVVWDHEDETLTAITYDGHSDRMRVFPAGLCKLIVQKLLDNPSQVEKFLDLYSDYLGIKTQLVMRDSGPIIHTFQVHDIVARNAFGPVSVSSSRDYREEDDSNASSGLWILASYSNDSCIPNAKKESIGNLMVLRSIRPIVAGDEITHSYDASSDYDVRTASLMNT